jgi:hypothetical protein
MIVTIVAHGGMAEIGVEAVTEVKEDVDTDDLS